MLKKDTFFHKKSILETIENESLRHTGSSCKALPQDFSLIMNVLIGNYQVLGNSKICRTVDGIQLVQKEQDTQSTLKFRKVGAFVKKDEHIYSSSFIEAC